MLKGQTAIEFIFTIGAVVFIFMIVLAVVLNKSISLSKTVKDVKHKDECLKIGNIITYSYLAGNNYSMKINSEVRINPLTRTLTADDASCSIPIAAINNGTFKENITLQKKGEYVNAN